MNFTQSDSSEIICLHNKYRALLRQSHIKWAQHSRLNWIDSGDLNFSFFHRSVRLRRHHNFVSTFRDTEGNDISDNTQILNTFIDHFSTLKRNSDQRSCDYIFKCPPHLPQFLFFSPKGLPFQTYHLGGNLQNPAFLT